METLCHSLKVTQLGNVRAGLNVFNPNFSLAKGRVNKKKPKFVVMINQIDHIKYPAENWAPRGIHLLVTVMIIDCISI